MQAAVQRFETLAGRSAMVSIVDILPAMLRYTGGRRQQAQSSMTSRLTFSCAACRWAL